MFRVYVVSDINSGSKGPAELFADLEKAQALVVSYNERGFDCRIHEQAMNIHGDVIETLVC
tara:strand:+ start:352 stop:534 length:183 start_codon:yes stop_codon:yes gene_type:complete